MILLTSLQILSYIKSLITLLAYFAADLSQKLPLNISWLSNGICTTITMVSNLGVGGFFRALLNCVLLFNVRCLP